MAAGINFVALGLAGIAAGIGTGIPSAIPDGTRVQLPKAMARSPHRLLRGTRRDLLMAAHLYSDPLPHLLEHAGILV